MIKRVAFVGQPTRDLDRAKRFYGEVLGLQHDHDAAHGRWSEFDAPDGTTIALDTFGPELSDSPSPYLALETDDLVAEVARLESAGVRVIVPVQINNNEAGREICRLAIILDSEDNPVMLHQRAAWREE